MKSYNFFLTGVGGQGTLLASDVVALVGAAAGFDVKKSEVHGMSQRGGSVVSQVRWGEKVRSPLVGKGQIDYYLGFEKLETLRHIDYIKPTGVVLVNDYEIAPVQVNLGKESYPDTEHILQTLRQFTPKVHLLSAMQIAESVGNARTNNVVMLGALSNFVDVPETIWLDVISKRVPERYLQVNLDALGQGKQAVQNK